MGKRKKSTGFGKRIIIDGFVNEREIQHYYYILEKYGMEDAACSISDMIDRDTEVTNEALDILDNDGNIIIRIEEIK